MKKIVLFGASRGGINFIENNVGKYQITAIIDNDSSKHGQLVNNIPVIAPKQMYLFTYDYIVVASMYVHSITKQLKNLGVSEEKIKYASKNSMKVISYPFKDERILDCANKMIVTLSHILKEIRHFHTFGTLLGIVRDGHLIPWDDDIDIAIYVEDAPKVMELLIGNVQEINNIMDTKMYMRHYTNGDIASITIDCYYSNALVFNINLDCIYVEGNVARQELNETPLTFFEQAERYTFNDHMINVPQYYEKYLEYTYGDWRVVKEHTTFFDNTLSFKEPTRSCLSETFYESNRKIT